MSVNLDYNNIFVFVGFAVGILLALLAMRRKPLFSFRNISVLIIFFYTFFGVLLLPYSLTLDKFEVTDSQIYLSSIKKSVFFHILGLWLFLISIIILDIRKGLKKISKTAFLQLLSYPERINYSQSTKMLTLALFVLLGSMMIYGTFWYTGNVPYCNFLDPSAKYFSGFTEKYIYVRPFYVLGQQLLAIAGFFLLYFFIKTLKSKEFKTAAIFLLLFLFSSFPLLFTMKRGEVFFPLIMYTGGMVLLNRIRIVQVAVIALALIWLAFVLDPSHSERPLTNLVCGKAVAVQKAPKVVQKAPKMSLKEIISNLKNKTTFFANSFFVQVRESSRLLYNFHYKDESYLYGRTFIAGALGFIPTAVFPFKEKNQIGRVTLRLFGINPETSGGPRIGIIGESYINFGVLCVVFPLLLGAFVWFLDGYYLWVYESYNGEHKMLHMSLMFMILTHLGTGMYLDGSGALQTFIIRAGILLLIMLILLWTRPNKKPLLNI